jgi:predicted ribosome quality control (RQC) complex YloA/Tae2 family protein
MDARETIWSGGKPLDWITSAQDADALPPFLRRQIEGGASILDWRPRLYPELGAYPTPIADSDTTGFDRTSISVALEQHFELAIPALLAEELRRSLLQGLERVLLARETALLGLSQAVEAGERANQMQRWGELILAYGPSAPAGASKLDVWDYDGSEVQIRVDPSLTYKENANHYFERARHAKDRLGIVREQITRITADHDAIRDLMRKVYSADRYHELVDLQQLARNKRWIGVPHAPTKQGKDDRPYQGHKIKELLGPGGYRVLYGETSESNDYLTMRVAKPNDMWLHVRGDTSAHVVILTNNHPEKLQLEHLHYAAKIAVAHSTSKHAGYVDVDYTLRRFVWKPRGSKVGFVLYKNEKTLHIDS